MSIKIRPNIHNNVPCRRKKNSGTIVKATLSGLLLAAFFLTGCMSLVYVDYDPEALDKMRNYTCFEIEIPENQYHFNDLIFVTVEDGHSYISNELSFLLKTRGYTKNCSTPDFRVKIHTRRRTVTKLETNDFESFVTFRQQHFAPEVGFFPPPRIHQYKESIFLIDIIDVPSGERVWRGARICNMMYGTLTREEISFIINEILSSFPFREKHPNMGLEFL